LKSPCAPALLKTQELRQIYSNQVENLATTAVSQLKTLKNDMKKSKDFKIQKALDIAYKFNEDANSNLYDSGIEMGSVVGSSPEEVISAVRSPAVLMRSSDQVKCIVDDMRNVQSITLANVRKISNLANAILTENGKFPRKPNF
jgi:hypothetical protein